jgi:sulfite oxidase
MRPTRREILKAAGAGGVLALLGFPGCSIPAREADGAKELLTRMETPFNAEPALEHLSTSWITPLPHFYVRSHGPVPVVDPAHWSLSVEGMVERPLSIPLDRLKGEFGSSTVAATLQCAGNRRIEHAKTKPIAGVQWDAGAIGNAEWRGPRLAELLFRAGVKNGARFAWFEGLDEPMFAGKKSRFGAAIPLEKAMRAETLVAVEMNGRPLAAEHGAPARTIVPGYVGARSVKWLGRIVVSDRTSDNPYSARDYKLFPPEVTAETVKWEEKEPILEYAISSAICSPRAGAEVAEGKVKVRGYALSPAPLSKVQVTADGGATWTDASLEGKDAPWTWRLWEAEVGVAKGARTLAVRATDSRGVTQPEAAPWNFKGYLYNGWHRVPVTAV